MTTATMPLLFPEILTANNLEDLNAPHGLTQADLDWLHHASLSSHTLRAAQTPPMCAETILLQADANAPIPLAGCLVLKALTDADAAQTQPAFLYTPYGGIRKFDSPEALEEKIDEVLKNPTQRDDLLRLLSISQHSELDGTTNIRQTRQTISGDVFKSQIESIEHAQSLNALTMLNELIKLPSLTSILEKLLNEMLPGLDHREARVSLNPSVVPGNSKANQGVKNISLSEAILVHFHNQGWPSTYNVTFIHPNITASPGNSKQWENIIKIIASHLPAKLTECINVYWDARSPFSFSRRMLLSQFLEDALRATILIQQEKNQLTGAQSRELLRLVKPFSLDKTLLRIETVRLWEHTPHYVELAGSLMISGKDNYLYTPNHGIQKVASYLDFKDALLNTPAVAESRQAIYSLLSQEERNRFLSFDEPQVSGKSVVLPVAESLANMIIAKQVANIHYVLGADRRGDMDVHSLINKALDIRTLISNNLLSQNMDGHWKTQRTSFANLAPSSFRADQLERKMKSYTDVENTFHTLFFKLPSTDTALLHSRLKNLLPEFTNTFSLGLRAEAELRKLDGTLSLLAHDLITTVFTYNSGYSEHPLRISVRGFRPDVYSIKLAYSADSKTISLPLASCFLLTERGGLDTPDSGMAILWTPAGGLQTFATVDLATEQLNRQLLDSQKRFGLLENLTPAQRKPHGRYQLQEYELIKDNVLLNRVNSFIDHFKAEHNYLSTLKIGDWQLTGSELRGTLNAIKGKGVPTNLTRAGHIAQVNRWKQKLPTWLSTAPLEEQRLHVELLEQYKNSVTDNKDYLDGIEPLHTYAQKKLGALLNARFTNNNLDPDAIQITPKLVEQGQARTLTDFALQPISVTRKPEFKVSSRSGQKLPDSLNETAVRQMLTLLDIPTTYRKHVTDMLSGSSADIQQRKHRFQRQLPWQLLQHAHALHLQQHLSAKAFDMIRQVLDMPDAIARKAVDGANALIRPLELIKASGVAPIRALGLYLIGSSDNTTSSQVLYSPYHEGHQLSEFKDEASVVAAFNKPGVLQDLLIRRLPESQQATFKKLFATTPSLVSKITLASNPIQTNLLETLFNDNITLLSDMLTTQTNERYQFDWETALHLFGTTVRSVGRQFQAKLTFVETLCESYQDFKTSSEALQQHDWKTGLHNFIAGSAEMVSLGMLNRDDTFGLLDPLKPIPPSAPKAPRWKEIASTAASRTNLQAFKVTDVSLANLQKSPPDGTFKAPKTGKLYTSIAGQVFQVAKANQVWRIVHENGEGPILKKLSDNQWIIDPQRQTIRYGKAMSTFSRSYSDRQMTHDSLNIEARGMKEIRKKYPYRANVITQAVEAARYYSSNALQNLKQLKQLPLRDSRLDIFLKSFFGVDRIDANLIKKIHAATSPICKALADPSWELQNGHRITICNIEQIDDDMSAAAFIVEPKISRKIYLTQFFFNMDLDWYKTTVPSYFNVDAHAQGAVLIHEISHQLLDTLDIIYLDATLPFLDLISTATHLGLTQYNEQKDRQQNGLSLTTPRNKLFMEWDRTSNSLKSLEFFPRHNYTVAEILKITGTRNMDEARDAFLDPTLPEKRIDIILRNADSMTLLICELGRQPVQAST